MIPCTHCGKPIIPGQDDCMQGRARVKGKATNVYVHFPNCARELFGLQKEVPQ